MDNPRQHRTDAELAILREIASLQQMAANKWRGMEKTVVVELVRSLDFAAVSQFLPSADGTGSRSGQEKFISYGALTALRPFLAPVAAMGGGVPWGRTLEPFARFCDSYLGLCGQLARLLRLAGLERYGLASTSFPAPGKVVIDTTWGWPEAVNLEVLRAWRSRNFESALEDQAALSRERTALTPRMRSYVEMDRRFFIRYENDLEIVDSYRKEARCYGSRFFEGEAFPPDVQIGGRSFGEWKDACERALGRILCHIDFALLLRQKRSKKVRLRDILTVFARRDDVAAVWTQTGLQSDRVDSTMAALDLSADRIDDWERAYEIPTPFYVGVGRDFVLLPCFGALTNPYFSLFRHLRNEYKAEWDRGVDRREEVFRSDLRLAFPEPRFSVPARGFKLKRLDGSTLTDVDAVVLDRQSGTLALLQLKWHDIFGLSLAERESRRRNIAEANKWIERVLSWLDGRSSVDVLRALGIDGSASAGPPVLYVLARYNAHFSGTAEQDSRATWLGWAEVLHDMKEGDAGDPLSQLGTIAAARRQQFSALEATQEKHQFEGLTVELRIASPRP